MNYFSYILSDKLIANQPVDPRDDCRLMVIDRQTRVIKNKIFKDLNDLLTPNDILVLNLTKVFPARLYGRKISGGKVEILLLRQLSNNSWEAICRPGLIVGQRIVFGSEGRVVGEVGERARDRVRDRVGEEVGKVRERAGGIRGEVLEVGEDGEIEIDFDLGGINFMNWLQKNGNTPIPPYIKPVDDENKLRKEYQTVYAKEVGSAAAPTAGMHFTNELLKKLTNKGIQIEYVTLHVGLGTFKPVTDENIRLKKLHREYFEIDQGTINRLNQAKREGKRIIAVGTTTTRVLETAVGVGGGVSGHSGPLTPRLQQGEGETDLFIFPPYKFKFIDGLITNFHLPKSSLLMLVAAFTSWPNTQENFVSFNRSLIGRAYQEAISKKYRFYSFGDAMLIL